MCVAMNNRQCAVAVALLVGFSGWAEPVLVPAPRCMKVAGGEYSVEAGGVDAIKVKETRDASLPPEGYRLSVAADGVSVASADPAGACAGASAGWNSQRERAGSRRCAGRSSRRGKRPSGRMRRCGCSC